MNIAILTPSRHRSKRLKIFVDSVYNNAFNADNIFFYNYVDEDDPLLEEYKQLENETQIKTYDMTYGTPMSVSKSWNILAEKAVNNGADILIMGNDDLIYRTKNWDTILLKEVEKYSDEIYCMYFDDLIWGEKHCAFPIVSKKWFNIVGHFTSGLFHFGYNDTWIFEIAKMINRTHYVKDVIAEHMHFSRGKAPRDPGVRNRASLWQKDKPIWENTFSIRLEIAKKLGKHCDPKEIVILETEKNPSIHT
jgi:hypothetical protein